MSFLIFEPNTDSERNKSIERRLKSGLPTLKKIKHVAEISDPTGGAEPIYLLMVREGVWSKNDIDKIVEEIVHETDQLFRILVSDNISGDDYKRLVRTEKADWVSTASVHLDAPEIISKRRAVLKSKAESRKEPIVISLVPSAGGVGNAFLAAEVGSSLSSSKSNRSRKVCVVDLDLQSGHVCDYLDIEPRLKIQEISNDPDRLDDQLFDIFVSRHVSGLHVFGAPRSKYDICELNSSALESLFDMILARYDLIIIDLPPMWSSWTPKIIARSDGILVTGVNTVPGLRQISETVSIIKSIGSISLQLAVIVNKCDVGFLGGVARQHHVKKVLGNERVFYLRNDSGVIEGINAGTSVAAARTSRKTLNEIAQIGAFCADARSVSEPDTART